MSDPDRLRTPGPASKGVQCAQRRAAAERGANERGQRPAAEARRDQGDQCAARRTHRRAADRRARQRADARERRGLARLRERVGREPAEGRAVRARVRGAQAGDPGSAGALDREHEALPRERAAAHHARDSRNHRGRARRAGVRQECRAQPACRGARLLKSCSRRPRARGGPSRESARNHTACPAPPLSPLSARAPCPPPPSPRRRSR